MKGPRAPARVSEARRLLEEGTPEYDGLPPACRAYLQEAIEFLIQVEADLSGNAPKK